MDHEQPTAVLIEAAIERLRPYGLALRKDGWDANIHVELSDDKQDPTGAKRAEVSLTLTIPRKSVPIETGT